MIAGIGERTLFDLYDRSASFEGSLKSLYRQLQQQPHQVLQTAFHTRMSRYRMPKQRESGAPSPLPNQHSSPLDAQNDFMKQVRYRLNKQARQRRRPDLMAELPSMIDCIRSVKPSTYRSLNKTLRDSWMSSEKHDHSKPYETERGYVSTDMLKTQRFQRPRVESLLITRDKKKLQSNAIFGHHRPPSVLRSSLLSK